ncbi:hypothetical protein MMC15_005222 [Xylographa vitiligo]|nr:hypothetical protein [Xylographa vitiligo]
MRPLTHLPLLALLAPLPRAEPLHRPLTDCTEGRNAHGLGGIHADWTFQQSFCRRDHPPSSPQHYRQYRIDCRAPGAASMLQGPAPWFQRASATGECSAAQICVDGPYAPPDAEMARLPWYKRHGTAYCVEERRFVDLGGGAG